MSMADEWRAGDVIQLLVPSDRIGWLMEEWLLRGAEADIRVRRAKTKGHVVIETRYLLYASWVVQHTSGAKVNIKKGAKI